MPSEQEASSFPSPTQKVGKCVAAQAMVCAAPKETLERRRADNEPEMFLDPTLVRSILGDHHPF
jgi:hypothetical protein